MKNLEYILHDEEILVEEYKENYGEEEVEEGDMNKVFAEEHFVFAVLYIVH